MSFVLGVLLLCTSLYTGIVKDQEINTVLSNQKDVEIKYLTEIKKWSKLIGTWEKNYSLWPDPKYLDAIGYAEHQIDNNINSYNSYHNDICYLEKEKTKYQIITTVTCSLGIYILVKDYLNCRTLDNITYDGNNLVYNIKF